MTTPEPTEPAPPSTDGLGRFMVIITWVIILALLTFFFNQWYKKYQMNTHATIITSDGIQQTVLQRNYLNHYVVEGLINNQKVMFLVDTGASHVTVPGPLAEKLNLKKGMRTTAQTAGGEVEVYQTIIDELVLGHIVLHRVKASINPHMNDDEILLGMSALKNIKFIQEDDTLTLISNTR
ncbi:TIGR02281 family clan AA aspartic protease [Candidatus Berkiella aquae]|uniref:Retroviral-like aspartic protease family protein n=1 Tax=Candidatus Berkiella aquae TaxID=295108 RepID=A0A0Q9YXD7_9GAMM|nr:retropepsin-like aspartic protease [Candidatus Berkiella aquae]MCS5710881.1 retroviral-like aspartic protease family protein [Candidatus Berkiella aquae]